MRLETQPKSFHSLNPKCRQPRNVYTPFLSSHWFVRHWRLPTPLLTPLLSSYSFAYQGTTITSGVIIGEDGETYQTLSTLETGSSNTTSFELESEDDGPVWFLGLTKSRDVEMEYGVTAPPLSRRQRNWARRLAPRPRRRALIRAQVRRQLGAMLTLSSHRNFGICQFSSNGIFVVPMVLDSRLLGFHVW